jgi:transcriptional regulator with XRE-family HTH domain
MANHEKHWTSNSVEDYRFSVGFNFCESILTRMHEKHMSQKKFAKRLGVTEGRVSQILNHPGNMTLSSMIKWAKVVGMKVSVLAYNDGDPKNLKGPIPEYVFIKCWELNKKPSTMFDLTEKGK